MSEADSNQQHPATQAVHHEMRNAANSAAYLLGKLEDMKAINPQIKLLDVGAGSGTISVALAKALPQGHVTATDIKEDILPRARAIAEMQGVSNIEVQQADVFALPFADASFDVAHCHQVLTHLKEPWKALAEMLRVTKPGGIVAAREGDFQTECIWPDLPGLVDFHDFAAKIIVMGGGSAMAGRQLLSWSLKAGVPREIITTSFGTWSYIEKEEKKVWAQGIIDIIKAGRLRDAGLKAKFVTESELEHMVKAWEDWAERDDSTLAMMSGEIVIQKHM